jgi:glutaconate CoA-transferase subunit B
MSRQLRDGEVVVIGANSLLPLAAARLAQLTHAPNLTLIAGASGGVNTLVEPLAPSSGDYANLVAEAVLDFPEVLMLQMGGATDVFFAGGIQIDRHGNCNLAYAGRSPGSISLRGPGSAGLPWAHRSGRTILYVTTHTTRTFVENVDFVSLYGHKAGTKRREKGGPELVVTPLCVMDFIEAGLLRLRSLHPGVELGEVVESTGFELLLPSEAVPSTGPPTPEELRLLRELDPDALLVAVV